jgi:cytochrome c-type biogenesis protein
MNANISVFSAFFAGLLSFLSPCVLPLFSSYLFFISGSQGDQLYENQDRKTLFSRNALAILRSTLFFILGFSVVFIALSMLVYGFIFFLGGFSRIVTIIAGLMVILLGCNMLYNFIPFLKYDSGGGGCATCVPEHSILAAKEGAFFHPASRPKGYAGAFLSGVAFGAGWTPCVGAFLGSILLLAGQSETIAFSAACLAAYSAGLGLPFLVAGFFWSAVINQIYRFRKLMPHIKRISGIFLILIGLMMALGRLTVLNAFFQRTAYALSQWAQSGGASVRLIPGLLFLVLALAPFAARRIKKRQTPRIGFFIWSFAFLALAVANAAGVINCAVVISRWLAFSGV